MTALEELLKRLRALEPGHSGVLVTTAELIKIDVAEVPDYDLKGHAEWLRGRLQFPCDFYESQMKDGWIFRRS